MYVFLALVQQMGLDGCLVGPPDAAKLTAGYLAIAPDESIQTGAPRGPFWAVGVRIEADNKPDIKLYDPWRGEAFPATFSKLKTDSSAYKNWFEDRAAVSGVSSEDIRGAHVFLTASVNALSPRMAMLDRKLKDAVDAKLVIDPAVMRDRFSDPKPAFWNPPNDRNAYPRTARMFLPVDQGGAADRTDPNGRAVYDQYRAALLPPPDRVIPPELLRNEAISVTFKEHLGKLAWNQYILAFIAPPPTPREQIQRGQFQDASRMLVVRQDEFNNSLLRIRNTPDAEKKIRDWTDQANEVYRSFTGAASAKSAIDELWRMPGAGLILDRAIGEVGQAEAALLIALCRHEQAERTQARLEHAAAADRDRLRSAAIEAWTIAAREWSGYREQYASAHASRPALRDHVKSLAERAGRLAHQQ